MEQRRCAHCGRVLDLNPRAKNQGYCGKRKECQRARKRAWQRKKMASDPDYRANQKECNKAWRDRNPDYWRSYRKNHPESVERNRLLQKARRSRQKRRVAKMDTSDVDLSYKTGTYWLIPKQESVAKMDASAQKVVLIPVT